MALHQTCEDDRWYASTKRLQLASLPLCTACRSVATLTLTVNDKIPGRLMAIADASSSNLERLRPPRVPTLQARQVKWCLPTAAALRTPICAFARACTISFGAQFVDTLDGIVWPRGLKVLEFEEFSDFNSSIAGVDWPAMLERLAFGSNFNQPMEGVALPNSLRQLSFGIHFNQMVEGVAWPRSLEEVAFGERFDHPIERVMWPDSIRKLSFGQYFEQPIAEVTWPASMCDLSFGEYKDWRAGWSSWFNEALDSTPWPTSLRRITVGHKFRQSLQGLGTWMPAELT